MLTCSLQSTPSNHKTVVCIIELQAVVFNNNIVEIEITIKHMTAENIPDNKARIFEEHIFTLISSILFCIFSNIQAQTRQHMLSPRQSTTD